MSLLVFIPLAPCALRKPYFVSNHLDYHNFVSAHLLISVSVLQIPNIRMVEVLGQILGLALSATAEATTETTAAEVAASQEAAHAEQCLQICHGSWRWRHHDKNCCRTGAKTQCHICAKGIIKITIAK